MNLSLSALKAKARQTLTGKYLTAISALVLTDLIYMLMLYFFVPENRGRLAVVPLLCRLIVLLLVMILLAGTNFLYLNFARGQAYHTGQIFYAFSHHPDRIILISAVLFVLGFICLLPLGVTARLVLPAYHSGDMTLTMMAGALAASGLLSAGLILGVVTRFAMVFYLYIDRVELTWVQLLAESQRLMRGNQLRYIRLLLSFLGLIALGLLSLGLALLWVIPYINMTNACFYLELAAGQTASSQEP